MTDPEPSLREIMALMRSLKASQEEMKASQEEMKTSQEETKVSLAEVKASVAEVKTSVAEVALSLEDHKAATSASFEAVHLQFEGVQASIREVWSLLGLQNQRIEELHQQMTSFKTHVGEQIFELSGRMGTGFGAPRTMIEARDFRLDDQARRISRLEIPNT